MKPLFTAFPFLAALLISACGSSLKVNTDYDRNADFTHYKTFSMYESENSNIAISDLNHNRIIDAIHNEMQKKGFTEDDNHPSLLVNVVAVLKDRKAVSSNTNYYDNGGFFRPYMWGGGMMMSSHTSYNVSHYKDGSLFIDVIDATSKKLLWQGVGNSTIDKPIKDPDTVIPQAIARIMRDFPPR